MVDIQYEFIDWQKSVKQFEHYDLMNIRNKCTSYQQWEKVLMSRSCLINHKNGRSRSLNHDDELTGSFTPNADILS